MDNNCCVARISEVLADPVVISRISDTKAAGEVKTLEAFCTILQRDPLRAFYGKKHVQMAAEAQAIETLLISDKLFRCENVPLPCNDIYSFYLQNLRRVTNFSIIIVPP